MSQMTLRVSQLNRYIKSVLEYDNKLNGIYVEGEISSFHRHFKSGHLYFQLKDGSSSIKAVMFSSNAATLNFEPEDGMQVIARGGIAVFERDGVYELRVRDMMQSGLGPQQLALQQLRQKLYQEGLFDARYKKPLPQLPQNIAIVTSQSGAAVRDVQAVLARRYPLAKLTLFPVTVQGEGSAEGIVRAVNLVSDNSSRFQVCILTRGGGSKENLDVFNTEAVARAVFNCKVPIISAVGHEIDTTLCDEVADARAATPTEAAEMSSIDTEAIFSFLDSERQAASRIMDQKLKMAILLKKNLQDKLTLLNPKEKFAQRRQWLHQCMLRINAAQRQRLNKGEKQLTQLSYKVETVSPIRQLQRGYSLIYRHGKRVRLTRELRLGDKVEIQMCDGRAGCTVYDIQEDVEL